MNKSDVKQLVKGARYMVDYDQHRRDQPTSHNRVQLIYIGGIKITRWIRRNGAEQHVKLENLTRILRIND